MTNRTEIADAEYASYDFGVDVAVRWAGPWELSNDGLVCKRSVTAIAGVGNGEKGEVRLTFVVHVDEEGGVVEAFAKTPGGKMFGHDPKRPGMFRTVLTVVVLSEGSPAVDMSLGELGRRMASGSVCGSDEVAEIKRLTRAEMVCALEQGGTSGSFFELARKAEVATDRAARESSCQASASLDCTPLRRTMRGNSAYSRGAVDAAESIALALLAEGIPKTTIEGAFSTMTDAIGNNRY